MAKAEPRYWKAYCDEVKHPGLWKRWYLNQCVAVGWPPPAHSYRDDRAGGARWKRVKTSLGEMQPGDKMVVHLRGQANRLTTRRTGAAGRARESRRHRIGIRSAGVRRRSD